MPVSRPIIKTEVEAALAPLASGPFTEATKLDGFPFWLTGNGKQALSVPFSIISRRHGGSPISPAATGQCKTVKDCIDLTHARANTPPAANAKFANKFHKQP